MPTLAEQMAADALAAQKFTRKFFVSELDFTPESITELDAQCDAAPYALRGGLTEANIAKLRTLWGAYLGEVIRRCGGGGEWISEPNGNIQRLALQQRDAPLYPHDKIVARLTQGKGEDLVRYFATACLAE